MMERYLEFVEQDFRGGMVMVMGSLVLAGLACLMDLWIAIDAARANGERICSRPLRRTGTKIIYFINV